MTARDRSLLTYIDLASVRVYAPIGVDPQERRVGAWYSVDVRIYYNAKDAMYSDAINHAINYATVESIIRQEMAQPCALIENAAYRIYTALVNRFAHINEGRLRVTKLRPPMAGSTASATFSIEW